MKHKPPAPTTTFDLGDGKVVGSTFEDIESSADRLAAAGGGMERVDWRRIRHEPFRRASGGINWTAIGSVAAIVAIPVAVLIALFL